MAQQQNPQQNAAAETEQTSWLNYRQLATTHSPLQSMMSLHTQQTSRQTMKQLKLA